MVALPSLLFPILTWDTWLVCSMAPTQQRLKYPHHVYPTAPIKDHNPWDPNGSKSVRNTILKATLRLLLHIDQLILLGFEVEKIKIEINIWVIASNHKGRIIQFIATRVHWDHFNTGWWEENLNLKLSCGGKEETLGNFYAVFVKEILLSFSCGNIEQGEIFMGCTRLTSVKWALIGPKALSWILAPWGLM